MNDLFKFQPISFSWVAIHPNPKGIIQFIGGAFFGTFPTLFYRYFLERLFNQGYTIIALPFRFSFRHWSIATDLLQEQATIKERLIDITSTLGYKTDVYEDKKNYFWVGHSLGCKYIALLEILGDLGAVEKCVQDSEYQYQRIVNSLKGISTGDSKNIKGQPSLLIAPDISDTKSAIPIRIIANFLDDVGLGVLPTKKQTMCFIGSSQLFKLTALISFDRDTIAGNETKKDGDVYFFISQLQLRCKAFPIVCPIIHKELHGKHLEPLGIKVGKYIIDLNPFDKFIEPIERRELESVMEAFLEELDQRRLLLDEEEKHTQIEKSSAFQYTSTHSELQ